MSLIRIRRDRKEGHSGGGARPPQLWKLLAGLVLVVLLMWYLSRFA